MPPTTCDGPPESPQLVSPIRAASVIHARPVRMSLTLAQMDYRGKRP